MSDHPLFTLAKNWETVEAEIRAPLKELIKSLVKYDCQLHCNDNNNSVDITVFNVELKKVTDWIEIQVDGAVGVIFDFYSKDLPYALSDRCEDYNATHDLVFDSDSDSDSDSD
jgi:hypothetical protein